MADARSIALIYRMRPSLSDYLIERDAHSNFQSGNPDKGSPPRASALIDFQHDRRAFSSQISGNWHFNLLCVSGMPLTLSQAPPENVLVAMRSAS